MSQDGDVHHEEPQSTSRVESGDGIETVDKPASPEHDTPSQPPLHLDEAVEEATHAQDHVPASAVEASEKSPERDDPAHSPHPQSPSETGSFKSPELQNVQLEELSLEEPDSAPLEHVSLEPIDVSRSPTEDPLATARPPSEHGQDASFSSNAAASASPADLNALLSPTKDSEFKFPVRDSMAASDVTDDDARFSTVLLSARQSLDPAHASLGTALSERLKETLTELPEEGQEAEAAHEDRRDTLDGNDIVRFIHQNRVHKKTASTSTIVSANNVPFILSHLDTDANRRSSQDGKLLQEELGKKRESQDAGTEQAIDWGFWGDVVSDYRAYAAAYPQQLAKAIEKGIPKSLRGMIWQLMSASKEPELEQTYLKLLKETSPHEKAITRDLGRTFPHHAFFTDGHGIGQENLFNVLKAYSLYDAEVGYCQGLPFVVAILLLNMPDEEAFCLLVRLMHSYDLRGHFLPEMPKLQQRMFQFDRLVEEILPVLHIHFIRQGIKSSMYCSQWFLTMFSYKFPLDIVFRIYDNVLASGIEALFSFSLCLLYKNEETLLSMKFDQLLVFLNTKMLDIYQSGVVDGDDGSKTPIYDIDQYVQDAVSMNITPFMLDQYANEYEELVRTRDAQLVEMDNLRNANRNLTAQVHKLEENLAQLNAEHVNVLNELVRARLRHEELEGELVRYKLLYAEAMHQSEDALSSHRMSRMSMFSRRSSSNTGSS